jgi:ATP-dependent DNA helicase RecG
VAAESDGFRLAEFDLASRGEGELAGTRQHGLPGFRVAVLPSDTEILEAARADLDELLEREGGIAEPYFGLLVGLACRRYGPSGALAVLPGAAAGREEAA